ncbi:hypothetical protein HBI56_123350 [Parastagonospora nodorum]|uniref:Uncharacterized protein n=1 Tax=Phaeosphaeria nodorum (strain SN15 / ATCC MYA-4574 / FGSC 10173) TaxID=321614 RepID=A0A7U2F8M6_PHANO|nr:hypothetical protein HBH56_093060 [Parastagonospora nodorum]QRC98419.1 hypothetical protein JI435_411980 [Parastagonospora nodorum SN15]KAH3936477.1 hypothetical protein HBH54_027710 [Parastagonospora nodorum]KAH3948144.1 hypothetical protein HBH53_102530 [Parastagonospora nodorum]KAH3956460.1 hypothetical protein HBH51_241040 [Parastagonospora nodorum]
MMLQHCYPTGLGRRITRRGRVSSRVSPRKRRPPAPACPLAHSSTPVPAPARCHSTAPPRPALSALIQNSSFIYRLARRPLPTTVPITTFPAPTLRRRRVAVNVNNTARFWPALTLRCCPSCPQVA